MFGTKCAVCGEKIGKLIQVKHGNDIICASCNTICIGSPLATIEDIKNAWDEIHRRQSEFHATNTFHSMGSGFVFVDSDHQWICFSSVKKTGKYTPIIAFSELDSYTLEIVGQKTITKSKSGVGRAIVGGALFGIAGAVIGAGTAEKETKTTGGINILTVTFSVNNLTGYYKLSSPPIESKSILDSIIPE